MSDSVANFLGFFLGGVAAALQKAWNISERAAALGMEVPEPQVPGVPNVVLPSTPTDPNDIGAIQ